MIVLIRVALQIVLFFLLIGLIVAIAAAETGIVEKIVLAVAAALLIWTASRVRRIRQPFQRV